MKHKKKRRKQKKMINNQKKQKKEHKTENTTGDIQIKQEVAMDTMATDMDSLGEKTGKSRKD